MPSLPALSPSTFLHRSFYFLFVATMLLLHVSKAFHKPLPFSLLAPRRPHHRRALLRTLVASASSSSPQNQKVGFVGLGYMGAGMVRRLLERGDDVIVWNRSLRKSEALLAEYPAPRVTIASTPRQVLEEAGLMTFSMLSTPEAAHAVFEGPDGVLAGVGPGTNLVDCATLEVKDMQSFDAAVREKGGRFLEAPVSGSKVPAEQGQLVFLTAGDQELFQLAQPYLEAMGKANVFLGTTGKGTEMKLVVNMVMATMMTSLAEGLNLAGKAGIDPAEVVKVLGLGAMANPMFALKGPKIIQDDHTPNFPLKHAQKDLAFALTLAGQLGARVPTAQAADEEYRKALAAGEGERDFSAVAHRLME